MILICNASSGRCWAVSGSEVGGTCDALPFRSPLCCSRKTPKGLPAQACSRRFRKSSRSGPLRPPWRRLGAQKRIFMHCSDLGRGRGIRLKELHDSTKKFSGYDNHRPARALRAGLFSRVDDMRCAWALIALAAAVGVAGRGAEVGAHVGATFPSDAVEGATTEVAPGVFQTVYSLPLRPLTPGEVRREG